MTPALTLPTNPDRFVEFATRVDPLATPLAEVRQVIDADRKLLEAMGNFYRQVCDSADGGADQEAEVRPLWEITCGYVAFTSALKQFVRSLPRGPVERELTAHLLHRTERLVDLLRTMAVVWEELDLETPDDIRDLVWTIRISPLAYLRAMWNLFWSSVRHPFSETTIELKTGRVLRTQ